MQRVFAFLGSRQVTLYSDSTFLAEFSLKKTWGKIILKLGTGDHIDSLANKTGFLNFIRILCTPVRIILSVHIRIKKKSASSIRLFIFEVWGLIHFNSTKSAQKITQIILLLSASAVRSLVSSEKLWCIKSTTYCRVRQIWRIGTWQKQNLSECATRSQTRSVSSGTSASRSAPSGLLSITYHMFWNLVTQDFIVLMEGAWRTGNIVANYVALPQLTWFRKTIVRARHDEHTNATWQT